MKSILLLRNGKNTTILEKKLTRSFVYFLKLMTSYQENKQLNTTDSWLSVEC